MTDTADRPSLAEESALLFLAGGGELGGLIRDYDWERNPLGPPEAWPQSLKTAVRIMLTSRQPIWIGWGPELIYLYNDAYKSIIGGKHPRALGKPTKEVWKEIWTDIGPLLDTAMGGVEGTYVEEQLLLMERNGYPEETYYTFSYSPIPDDDGTPGGIICANTADTERVVGERQVALLRELAARTVDSRSWEEACRQSLSALETNPRDINFVLLYVVQPGSAEAILAGHRGLPEGHPGIRESLRFGEGLSWPIDGLSPDQPPRLVDLVEVFGAQVSGRVWDRPTTTAAIVPVPATRETGRSGFLIVGLSPYRLFDASYVEFLKLAAAQIAVAIASADAYQEERRRVEALAELDRAKTAFFSNVSHEFRTPLTLMLGPLEEMLRTDLSVEEARRHAELAHRNGNRLLRLVNSLLDFSRIEAGRVQAAYRPTDLSQFSGDIASSFRSAIEKAGLELVLECAPLPHPVYVDREMWEKILLNLLSNAFKFTFEGRITVSVRASPDGQAALVQVRDSGIGIAENEIPLLFERFHRVKGAQSRSFEGSGIGLALVQELVRLHGGEIEVESVVGRGTSFTIALPFGRAHLPRAQVLADADLAAEVARAQEYVDEALAWLPDAAQSGGEETDASSSDTAGGVLPADRSGAGRRIVLADDNADMRSYVGRLLVSQGYQVVPVADGEAAVAAVRRERPDLVLSDVMMPGLDGFGVLRALRGDAATAGIPIILLSARAGEEAKVEGLEAGADDYLVKPFAARELLARVGANIQMAALRREASRAIFESEQKLLMTRDRLALALSTGRVAVFEWNVDSDNLAISGPLAEVFGIRQQDAEQGLPLADFVAGIEPGDRDRVMTAVARSIATGEPYQEEYRVIGSGSAHVVVARGRVETGSDGAKRMVGVVIDITEAKEAENEIRESRTALEVISRASAAVSGDLDHERLVQTIIDACVSVTGAEFGAFFYNVVDEAGERYMLYSLSGTPREAFAKFPMPRNTAIFEPTFSGTGVVLSDDITRDPRYGRSAPYHGMPPGHLPVRSYLAVPVRSRNGEVLGGLFLGHSAPAVFGELAKDRVLGLASQAAVAMDNARLFEERERELKQRRQAEAALKALNETLEQRVASEVEERSKAEEALRQAQKMEAVGQLTGGVAHDFNNLLTIIIGGLETIRRAGPGETGRVQRAVDMALQGAQRAASLTARLLAFSRRQPLAPRPVDLNVLVRDMTELLHRTLGEQIELESVLAPRLWPIEVDPNQLESALINLAVNARDAMPSGGKLTIETTNTALDESYAAVDSEVKPGQYVAICVSDSGHGMSPETLSRVFEPFFTTKEVGRGTGLGLSMVYGFVKQSGGHVTIYSEEGQGTTVKMYFPRFLGATTRSDEDNALAVPTGSDGEVVLVVEDNDDVRTYSSTVLKELGYRVLEASESEAALAILRGPARIDLLFTDVVLPGRSGRVLADMASELRPGLKILFTTGYSRNAIVHQGRLDVGVQLITKPFTFEQLAARIRDVLDMK
jgi:signal transduction histidine kinase/DNA-binding response OmpR family regulator